MFLFCSLGVKRITAAYRAVSTAHQSEGRAAGASLAMPGPAGTKNNIRRLVYLHGARRMRLADPKRPVVLIVEDEFLLRMDAADMIAAAGFEVLEAGNSDEAIEILEARRDISVVFTDIQVPGSMDGLKLARAVRGRWPPIKIIATSGHVHIGETDLPEGGRFLAKPYSSKQVMGILQELMGG